MEWKEMILNTYLRLKAEEKFWTEMLEVERTLESENGGHFAKEGIEEVQNALSAFNEATILEWMREKISQKERLDQDEKDVF